MAPATSILSAGESYRDHNRTITLEGYSSKLLTKKQFGTVYDMILDQIAAQDSFPSEAKIQEILC